MGLSVDLTDGQSGQKEDRVGQSHRRGFRIVAMCFGVSVRSTLANAGFLRGS